MESALFNITGWNLLIAFGLKRVAAKREGAIALVESRSQGIGLQG